MVTFNTLNFTGSVEDADKTGAVYKIVSYNQKHAADAGFTPFTYRINAEMKASLIAIVLEEANRDFNRHRELSTREEAMQKLTSQSFTKAMNAAVALRILNGESEASILTDLQS